MLSLESYRDDNRVAAAVEAAGIDKPLKAFRTAFDMVSSGRARSVVFLTQYFETPPTVASALIAHGETMKKERSAGCRLAAAARVFGKQALGLDQYDNLFYRVTRPLDPDFTDENGHYLQTSAWVAQTHDWNVLLGIQSAVGPSGEISRRWYLVRKPFDPKETLVRWVDALGDAMMAPGFHSEFWRNPFIPPPETPGTRS